MPGNEVADERTLWRTAGLVRDIRERCAIKKRLALNSTVGPETDSGGACSAQFYNSDANRLTLPIWPVPRQVGNVDDLPRDRTWMLWARKAEGYKLPPTHRE
jgi:hypothetical protein